MGHAQIFTEAPASACPEAIGERSRKCPADDADEGDRAAVHVAKRRYRPADHRWPGDSSAPRYRADGRAEIIAPAVGHQPARTPPTSPRM